MAIRVVSVPRIITVKILADALGWTREEVAGELVGLGARESWAADGTALASDLAREIAIRHGVFLHEEGESDG